MILVIDNYDSFVYNLVQYIGEILSFFRTKKKVFKEKALMVFRNDKISIKEIQRLHPECIIISPGPCTPKEAGISVEVVKSFSGKIPILGVCLGHQSIAYAFNGKIVRAKRLMHGKTSMIYHDKKTIFKNIPNPFEATRYHSLIVDNNSLPKCFEISAWTKENEIMGIRLKNSSCSVEGVQFHPESILTKEGKNILRNFLQISKVI